MGKGLSIDFVRGAIVAYGNKVEYFFFLFVMAKMTFFGSSEMRWLAG